MSTPSEELVSRAEFGRRMKLSRSRLRTLARQGLPSVDGKVPLAAAKAWLAENVDPARKDHWKGAPSLNDLRRARERLKVDAGRLELSRRKGELVERAAVRKFLADRARMERDRWLSWSSAAAARLAADLRADTGRLFALLDAEVRDHLRQLASEPLMGNDDDNETRVA